MFIRVPSVFTRVLLVFIRVPSVFTHVPLVFIRVPSVFTRVPLVFIRVPSVFTRVPLVFIRVPSVFTRVPLVFIRVPSVFTRGHWCSIGVHSCSDLCGVLDMTFSYRFLFCSHGYTIISVVNISNQNKQKKSHFPTKFIKHRRT